MADPPLKMRHWDTVRFYDPITDADAMRYNGYSGRGVYWVSEALTGPGKSRRAQRERVLSRISRAIERGDAPGEVTVDEAETEQASADPVFDPTIY